MSLQVAKHVCSRQLYNLRNQEELEVDISPASPLGMLSKLLVTDFGLRSSRRRNPRCLVGEPKKRVSSQKSELARKCELGQVTKMMKIH